MRIRLDPEQVEPFVFEEELEFPPALLDSCQLEAVGPIHCKGRLQRVASGYLFDTTVDYEQTVVCTRCLKPLQQEEGGRLELFLVQGADPAMESDELQLDEGDLDIVHVSGDFFVTDPVVSEHIQLQAPMKPLCKEDCLGLCPRCGADRNASPDCCDETGYDPHWSDLLGLRDQLRENES